ncbi:MAG TPA: DUF1476 domain-containing protein [Rhizomicrobium sp.]|nr:DUF1476 domain-containing protein [Rhizomicrobium sp.]
MSDGFRDREKSFEAKWAHDEELRFKVMARRNKLLGLWAAELMGLNGAAADAYARTVIQADFQEAGDDDVLRKVKGDFEREAVSQSAAAIRARMEELLSVAAGQVMKEVK